MFEESIVHLPPYSVYTPCLAVCVKIGPDGLGLACRGVGYRRTIRYIDAKYNYLLPWARSIGLQPRVPHT